ncbi:MAG: hypothetical protein UU40_C0003G0082, partial [Candidatus Uhrbacteria bacterium GW2011_GWD2_41_121]
IDSLKLDFIMARNILPMTFLLCPYYDIIIWAGQENVLYVL